MAIQAQQYPVFYPGMRIITAITNANPASVTTSFAHGYASGLIVRLVIPLGFGMQQANDLYGNITVTGSTTFTISIDTTLFSPFVVPMSGPASKQAAQAVPFGEISSTVYQATVNVLPYPAN